MIYRRCEIHAGCHEFELCFAPRENAHSIIQYTMVYMCQMNGTDSRVGCCIGFVRCVYRIVLTTAPIRKYIFMRFLADSARFMPRGVLPYIRLSFCLYFALLYMCNTPNVVVCGWRFFDALYLLFFRLLFPFFFLQDSEWNIRSLSCRHP